MKDIERWLRLARRDSRRAILSVATLVAGCLLALGLAAWFWR